MGRGEVHVVFWWGNMRERGHLEDSGVDGRIMLNWIFNKWMGGAWTGLIWLRIRKGGGLLWMSLWTFLFHKMWGISWLAEDMLGSQEGLCYMELVCVFCVCVCKYICMCVLHFSFQPECHVWRSFVGIWKSCRCFPGRFWWQGRAKCANKNWMWKVMPLWNRFYMQVWV